MFVGLYPRNFACRFDRRRLALLLAAVTLFLAPAARSQQPYDSGYPAAGAQDNGTADTSASPEADPPSRVARLSGMDGSVSVEPASVNEFSPAELNYPLTTGDRVWADNRSVAELEVGQLAVRMGELTDLSVTAMTDTLAQFGLGQGSVHLRTYALDQGTTTELDTPNVAITVLAPGDARVDVDPNSNTTIVTVLSGEVEVDGNGLQQTLGSGQRVRLAGTDPVSAQWLQGGGNDGLDTFSSERDQTYKSAEAAEQSYVNPDTVGGADLQQYGTWSTDADYGEVWYPTGVAVGWQPYLYGHWTWVAPWGWTWVENEPWGFAPFHYGRWAQLGGRWGWIPGPPVVHPVYSPGLVVFVGAGSGVTAWFPLGPHEPYAPWYHASVLYRNRVNVSNIYDRNSSNVRAIFRTGNREVYADPLGAQQRFANRAIATVAMPQDSFAGGRAASSSAMRLRPEQVAGAAVLPHPLVTPERTIVAPANARAVPPHLGRPTLASRQDRALQAGPSGRVPAAAPKSQPSPAEGGQAAPVERRSSNASGSQPGRSGSPYPQPESQIPSPAMTIEGGVRPPNPARGTEQLPQGSIAPRQQQPNEVPAAAERPLYNRAVPPPSRPSFDQQREAIQRTDPGRPLSPQQLENLRESRPAGPPQSHEAAPHPAPEPRSAPPPPPSRGESQPQSHGETKH